MDLKGALGEWGSEADSFSVTSAEETGAALLDRADEIALELNSSPGDPRLRLSSRVAAPSGGRSGEDLAALAVAVEAARSGATSCAFEQDPRGFRVETTLWEDGFTRNALNAAVLELRKARRALDVGLVGAEAAAAAGAAEETEKERREPAAEPSPEPAATPSSMTPTPTVVDSAFAAAQPAAAQPFQQAQPAAQPVQVAAAQPAAAAQPVFAPSSTVPQGGMAAWAAPDPNAPSVAQLAAGLPLEVVEVRGAWAHVRASNGWMGWVDGRRLVPPVAS